PARPLLPARRFHQLGPAAIEFGVIAFAEAVIADGGAERRIEALTAEPHLGVYRDAAGHHPAAGLGAFLPIIHVVLLEGAAGAEAADAGQLEAALYVRRRRLGRQS